MKRLVYTPRTEVYVKADSGIYDISPYITEVSVDRKINQLSTARVAFRNPKMMFTDHSYIDPITGNNTVGPVFHPMDPIIITMTRIKDRPIQVFTGYCDKTPYFQLFPGTCVIEASCTLKRLQYTYWDPGLPFVLEFMQSHGWALSETGIVNAAGEMAGLRTGDNVNKNNQIQDEGFSNLLMSVLTEIGGWDENNIFIEKIPNEIVTLVVGLFETFKSDSEQASQEFRDMLKRIIGTTTLGGAGGGPADSGTGSSGPLSGGTNPEKIFNYVKAKGLDCKAAAAVVGNAQQESGCNPGSVGGGLLQWQGSRYSGLQSFAKGNVNDLQTQLDWMWHELQTGYQPALAALRGGGSLSDKTSQFCTLYEGAGDPQMQNRINYAQDASNKFCK